MKKNLLFLLASAAVLSLAACGRTSNTSANVSAADAAAAEEIAVMDDDSAVTKQLLEEAVDNYNKGNLDIKYNDKSLESATLEDVLEEGGVDYHDDWFVRVIGGTKYSMIRVKDGYPNGLMLSELDNNENIGIELDGSMLVSELKK